MIYSLTPKLKPCNLSALERTMLKKLKSSKRAQWMLDRPIK